MTSNGYTVSISGLRVHAIVGVHPYERTAPQPLLFDIQLQCAAAPGDAHEALEQVTDYTAVAADAQAFAETGRFRLLETLATQLADLLLEQYPVTEVTLRVGKPRALVNAAQAAVQVTRTRQ